MYFHGILLIKKLHSFDKQITCFKKKKKDILNNHVKKNRAIRMMSEAELARLANLSVQNIDRIKKGRECRLDTRRKIIIVWDINGIKKVMFSHSTDLRLSS